MTVISPCPFSYTNFPSVTEFRHWVNSISSNLATVGIVKTSDTGQINPATVTVPATNTAAGYEIWRFDDSLQGTFPVYMKIEYGVANTTARPSIWLTVGQGSDGAGNLTGTLSTRTARGNQATGTANVLSPHVISGTTSRLSAMFNYIGTSPGNSNIVIPMVVERTCDSSGRETADGVVISIGFGACQILTSTLSGPVGNGPCLPFDIGASTDSYSLLTSTAAVGTGIVLIGGNRFYTVSHLSIDTNVLPMASTRFSCVVLGRARTYIQSASGGGIAYGNPTGVSSCMLWE